MIKLQNIRKSSNLIECDFLPEDSVEYGHIILDTISGEIIQQHIPNGYGWCKKHLLHAVNALMSMINEDSFPKEKIIMWN